MRKGQKISEETRQRMSIAAKKRLAASPMGTGENHPGWRGGKEKYKERRLEYNKEVASQRGECPDCGKKIWNHGGKCFTCAGKDKIGRTMITFQCDFCSKEVERELTEYNRNEHHYCSKKCEGLHRREIMPHGKDHWNYTTGLTPLFNAIRLLAQYKDWRKDVFERDEYACQCCGDTGYIQAHHIKKVKDILMENNITTIQEAKVCDELWNTENGITFCIECHEEAHINERRTA